MILRKYPEIPESLQKNYIVHFSSADSQLKNHVSPLSIKCSMNGLENFKTPDGDYEVTTGTYLIVNNGQHCSGYTQKEAEIFSIYLDSKFVEETLRSLVTPSDKILNFSFHPNTQPVIFFEKLYNHNKILSPLLMKLRLASKVNHNDEEWLNEQFYDILEKLLIIHRNIHQEIEKLPPIKLSTKIELYKRVCRAKEFMDTSFSGNITLEKISKEACLSQFHFLRLFKIMFNETPHQYIIKKRIQKALSLLRGTDMSITNICFEIGFVSLSSFSGLFRKTYGISPEVCREYFRKYSAKYKIN